ncbi:30S ribosomal protein S2 [Candidatus Kaiserbacteria bacterium RIFCSPHIGHO2_02_FULL_50_9]|uniref:Small ribosomal subunit protein uS2 n=1 Tax=Candidatus Kaiserbacteria bacterium RIFCSPLOWO2_01_FULL_51_21 TaxID=1798508 RepID=A0A1F6EE99_9BACT|nr:MAG: 30S ribosomal protein S2 [Candidatus Kaiserbacteria bacterium RIFCSPHIGHO2_01_FULL_51_33]OGG63549.1 MAG: 30S ribosomal protein S2 [Candidatus Kaiserbacteria bacterium RIFCSPHIGHO2_02_FULL_50_9]OGG71532.1 MAG: 30S ribosomal protein S2 [Candidatus Kaiserbacteria bacterium RIFCSPLOWO2_01_FULL_51_21]
MAEKVAEKSSLINELFKAGAHFGYSRSRRHPSVIPYIFGTKNRVEIFDLTETEKLLDAAKEFAETLGKEGKTLLFVSGKPEAREAIAKAATSLNQPYVASRWIGGTITNWNQIKKRLEHLADLTRAREKGELSKYTKWERLAIDKEIEDLEMNFSGIKDMKELPNALFIVDTRMERAAVTEALKTGTPTIALINSDCDATEVTYPIVGNDATMASISFFVNEIAAAYASGKKQTTDNK